MLFFNEQLGSFFNKNLKICLILFFGLVAIMSCTTVVPAGHSKVGTLFGKVQPKVLSEGLHIVNPLVRFSTWDIRDITVDIQDIMVPAQDKLKTDMDISLVIRIDEKGTPFLLQNVGNQSNVINQIVVKKARSYIREQGKSVELSQDFFKDEVQSTLQENIKNGLNEYLGDYHIKVKAVLFRDITLPKLVSKAIERTKERQELLNQEKAQLAIVEQQAQQRVKQAQADEQAAEAKANAVRIQADAEAYRIDTVTTAEAKANEKLAKSLTSELIEYKKIERWNGQQPNVVGGDSGMIFRVN